MFNSGYAIQLFYKMSCTFLGYYYSEKIVDIYLEE